MDQYIKEISIEELVLWTENPRDPIDKNAKDQDIVDKALDDKYSKWTLNKLAKEMGPYYDLSELPTVVYHQNKPIVYDGNRRVILGKIKHGLVSVSGENKIQLPDFPKKIPCNVCKEKIGLQNIFRKHADSGSWHPLERDLFLHKFMGKDKSIFLILDEETGIISSNPHLNQGFVKDEILKEDILAKLGFSVKNDSLYSSHNEENARSILNDLENKIRQKEISTRKNRGKVIEILEPSSQQIIDDNKKKPHSPLKIKFVGASKDSEEADTTKAKKKTKRRTTKKDAIFGGNLYLVSGDVSDLYRDIEDLYTFYLSEKKKLSSSFQSLIRMSLRLLCDTAAKDKGITIDALVKNNFEKAKGTLDKDEKTTLSTQSVRKENLLQLLHVGAHNYQASNNIAQTLAVSIIIGAILTITHGKGD